MSGFDCINVELTVVRVIGFGERRGGRKEEEMLVINEK